MRHLYSIIVMLALRHTHTRRKINRTRRFFGRHAWETRNVQTFRRATPYISPYISTKKATMSFFSKRPRRASSSTSVTTLPACRAAPYIAVRTHPLTQWTGLLRLADTVIGICSRALQGSDQFSRVRPGHGEPTRPVTYASLLTRPELTRERRVLR